MKKWLIAFLMVVTVSLICIYVFIPSRLFISKVTTLYCSPAASYRFVSNQENWKKWWPEKQANSKEASVFRYKADTYSLEKKMETSIEISIRHKDRVLSSTILLLSSGYDSVVADWRCEWQAGWNPVSRFRNYNEAVEIKHNLDEILDHLQEFLKNKDSVYEMHIEKMSTIDTLLISTTNFPDHYPTTSEIYGYIQPIHEYLRQQGALETSVPMLHVSKTQDGKYKTRVAIPTNKKLPGKDKLEFKNMIRGTFLVAEIKGGEQEVNHGLDLLQLYAVDYNDPVMAIPFQYLVTDRIKEPDSSKWITRIYLPVYQ